MFKQQGGFYRQMMELAISEMKKSVHEDRDDKTSPSVGAVLVKPDKTIVTAYRGEFREGDHAEYTLLDRKLRLEKLDGSILFTTLEPCMERKPPKVDCAQRIINARIKEVWVGIEDPDPTVDRKGIKYLQDRGIIVHMFDRDLQLSIQEYNKAFLIGAKERARKVNKEKEIVLNEVEESKPEYDLRDFSNESIELFKTKLGVGSDTDINTFSEVLVRLGICHIVNQKIVPSGNGILLFGKNPRQLYQQAGLVAKIIYPDTTVETKTFDGPLVLISKDVEKWYKDKLPFLIDRSGAERKQSNSIPFEIIREAIVNALIHRDYSIEGAKCQLEISLEKVIVKSPGEPVKPLTLSQMQDFSAPQLSRNPLLHYIFNLMDLAEESNFGMETWKNLPAKYKLPLPRYTFEAPYLILTVYSSMESTTNDLPEETIKSLNESEIDGWKYLVTKRSITRADYEKQFNIDDRTAQRHLKKFIELGLVNRVGSGPSTRYVLR